MAPLAARRAWPLVVSVGLVAATLSPLCCDPLADRFPLSTYPMFAVPRSPQLTLVYALGVTATGATRSLPPRMSGSSELLQAGAIYDDAVAGGGARLAPLCRAIAVRIATESSLADITTVRIVVGTHDALALLEHGTRGVETLRWTCVVDR